jgi:hypothetical protein
MNAGFLDTVGLLALFFLAVMRRLGIRRAFTNDRHFQEAGFETIFWHPMETFCATTPTDATKTANLC